MIINKTAGAFKYPISRPSITGRELERVVEAIQGGWISSKGPFVDEFENRFAQMNGYRYGVACSSGTAALFLALKSLGVGPGYEVIVPEFTMAACAFAVTQTGATPVFVDCDDRLVMDPNDIKKAITPRTAVIMPVHIYGRVCDMKSIMEIADLHDLYVVEDMAEAHGVMPVGDIACYSFYANKVITTGEGGMCLTEAPLFNRQMRLLRDMFFDDEHTFTHHDIGYNFRMTSLQAALGLAQLDRVVDLMSKRRQIDEWYSAKLPKKIQMPKRDVLWIYDINLGPKRNKVKARLEEAGIQTRNFFRPMSAQLPYFNEKYKKSNAEKWSQQGLQLPTYTDMVEEDVEYICNIIKEALG